MNPHESYNLERSGPIPALIRTSTTSMHPHEKSPERTDAFPEVNTDDGILRPCFDVAYKTHISMLNRCTETDGSSGDMSEPTNIIITKLLQNTVHTRSKAQGCSHFSSRFHGMRAPHSALRRATCAFTRISSRTHLHVI